MVALMQTIPAAPVIRPLPSHLAEDSNRGSGIDGVHCAGSC
jgi:hypothetical protein